MSEIEEDKSSLIVEYHAEYKNGEYEFENCELSFCGDPHDMALLTTLVVLIVCEKFNDEEEKIYFLEQVKGRIKSYENVKIKKEVK